MSKSVIINCMNCNKEHLIKNIYSTKGKFCSPTCQHEYQYKERVTKWLNGEDVQTVKSKNTLQISFWVKRALLEIRGPGCEICKIEEWNGHHIVLQCDHIDGDAANNKPENLRLICPNCHSQTETWGNKGGRKSSRLVAGKYKKELMDEI